MTTHLTSPSFPHGIQVERTEAEARASLSIVDVIRNPAPVAKLEAPKPCPFCGEDPPLAQARWNLFFVGCDNENCHVEPQVQGKTLSEAWSRWNSRK